MRRLLLVRRHIIVAGAVFRCRVLTAKTSATDPTADQPIRPWSLCRWSEQAVRGGARIITNYSAALELSVTMSNQVFSATTKLYELSGCQGVLPQLLARVRRLPSRPCCGSYTLPAQRNDDSPHFPRGSKLGTARCPKAQRFGATAPAGGYPCCCARNRVPIDWRGWLVRMSLRNARKPACSGMHSTAKATSSRVRCGWARNRHVLIFQDGLPHFFRCLARCTGQRCINSCPLCLIVVRPLSATWPSNSCARDFPAGASVFNDL
jgi:hypothetical protein